MFKSKKNSTNETTSNQADPDKNTQAIVLIQSLIRGYQTRKRYQFNQLAKEKMLNYRAFLLGNDPIIQNLNNYAPKAGGVALIATSGFRAIQLACELGANDKSKLPRVFIVDTSKEVHELWRKLKKMASSTNKASFFVEFANFLTEEKKNKTYRDFQKCTCKCQDCESHLEQDPVKFFDELINLHGYSYVCQIIHYTVLIQQSFADQDTFIKIKNHLNNLDIKHTFVYPSNIITDIYWLMHQYRPLINLILKNIELLEPEISIHTNLCRKHWEPKNVFIVEDQSPEAVIKILGLRRQSSAENITPITTAHAPAVTFFTEEPSDKAEENTMPPPGPDV